MKFCISKNLRYCGKRLRKMLKKITSRRRRHTVKYDLDAPDARRYYRSGYISD